MNERRRAMCYGPSRTWMIRTSALFGVLFGFLAGELAAQQPTVLAPDARLGPGTAVHSPPTGITFTVPAGYEGGWDGAAGGVLLQSGDGGFAGVWGVSTGTAAELAEVVGELLAQEGMQLQLRGQPVAENGMTVAEFTAYVDGGQTLLVAALRDGEPGSALVSAALGSDAAAAREIATGIARGASFGRPEASGWAERAAGLLLTTEGVDSAYSPGGVGDGTYTSQSTAELALCRDGRYAFQSVSESYVSVMGAGGFESTSREEHQGSWAILSDLAGGGYVALEATDGSTYLWTVEETADGAVVDGTAYAATAGPC